MSVEELKAAQSTTEATLLKCINVTSPFPAPGRPIRSLVARCFLIIYSRGETRTMYDTVQACLKVAGDSKLSEKDGRLAALYVLGEIMAAHGSQLMSFAMEVALITTRALKSSSNSLLLRTHGLRAVARVIPTAGKALTDAATKDLMKQLKSCLTDKSMVLQREAAEVLLALHAHLNQLRSPPEIEQILGLCVKSFDTSDKPTRRALSRLRKKVAKKDQSGSDDDTPSHATTTNQVEVLSADTMLGLLATQFHKPSTHRRARVGIAECYSALFVTLGRTWVESHYSLIASHLLKLLDHPRLRTAGAIMPANHVRYERLLARQIVGALLRQRTLSERGQIAAVRILSADYLTKWPAVMPGSIAPTPDVLVACLREIAALLDQLGNAPPPVQEALADPLVALSAHPRHSVQVAAAWTLRAFCNAAPNRLAPTVTNVLEQLQKDVSGLGNPAAPADLGRRAVGKAKALAALLALAPTRPLYVSGELAAKVLDCAVSMLKKSGEHAVHIASVEVECSAVGALAAFLESCGPHVATAGGLVTLDVGRRLTTLLSNALAFASAATTYFASLEMENQGTAAIGGIGLSLRDLGVTFRTRALICFSLLGFALIGLGPAADLIKSTISIFAGPGVGNSMQAAIATAAGTQSSHAFFCYGSRSDLASASLLQLQPLSTQQLLFASLLPTQEHSSVYSNVQFLIESCRSPKLDRNAGRKAAVLVNTAVALTRTLRIATETGGEKPEIILESNSSCPTHSDHVLRIAASEALGRLAALGSTNFLTAQVKYLVDQVVINRDPDGRAGCALAFGAIYSHVGGLAAGPLLKTTVNVLMSLGNDPHPVVHYYSLKGLAQVIDAASLSYSPHIASTLGSLCTIYLRDTTTLLVVVLTHRILPGSACIRGDMSNNRRIDWRTGSRTTRAFSNPVTCSRSSTRISEERDEGIAVEAIKCSQHVLMFASGFVDTPALVDRLRANLVSTRRPLKLAAINGLYQLVQKDALLMSKVGGDKLVEDLFGMLDDDPTIDGVRDVILNLCQRIMARTTASQQVATRTTVGLRDEESEGLGAAMGLEGEAASESSILTSRWRTQLFALQCLHDICNLIARSGRREHVDIPFAKLHGIPTNHLLITRVPDLIKMAFTASAAYVTEIRMEGLVVLKDVIQAPITAALTPAFSSDSTPDVLASAIQCINLEPGLLSIGDVQQLGPNASVMLRVSTLTAWAELEIASAREEYLQAVLKPYRGTLALLWVSALRDYASIRADSEVQQDGVAGMDSAYTGLGRETLLPYYSESWSKILAAVGCEMKAGDPHILQAMDGIDPATTTINTSKVTRKDPTGCFFVILGLVYEALSNASSDSTATSETKATALTAIQVLAYLVRPEYAGQAILDQPIFDELVALWYRMTMTEPWSIQTYLVGTIASFAKSQHATLGKEGIANGIELMGSETPIAQCLKACVMIIKNAIPSPQAQSNNIPQNPADRILLLISAFQALMAIGEVAGPATLPSVRALAISIYSDLLKDEYSEIDLVGPTLQSLRGMLLSDSKDVQKEPAYSKVVHGLLSACLQNVDDMSGRMGKASVLKTKNNLLAAVLILTVTPAEVKLSRAAVEHCCFLISQKLNEPVEISLAAAQCLKTLVTVSQSNPLLQYVASMLFPGAISFVVNCTGEDETGQVDCLPTLEEIFRAFTSFFSHVSEDNRPRVLGALMPPITCLLQAGEDKDGNLHRAAVSQLLTFASTAPTAFKEAAGLMKQEQRETMEASIRQAVVEQSKETCRLRLASLRLRYDPSRHSV
ncbi:Clathrin-coated vesicle protein [Rhizoctonia solani]|uniref:Clathrin-coated vesicle protein n=1 Tax=Rhizoctonia solani TaxID=456999 RepID=A0A8H7IMK6_9AGAM|nr:Clathrin-coated vesicle protein [Rhizoctonia solani]